MSNMIKRVLAMALILAMVLSFVPAIAQTAQAATTTDTSGFAVADLGITVTNANGSGTPTASWTATGNTITGSLVGGTGGTLTRYYYESTTSITLTNNKATEAELTLTYSATTTGSAYGDITVNGVTHTASVTDQTVVITLPAGEGTTITLHVPQRSQFLTAPTPNGASISIQDISLVSESAVEVSFGAAENGSYTVTDASGSAVTVPGTVATTSTTRYTLTATPSSGYTFAGWYATDAAGVSTFLSGKATLTTGFEESATVAPRFISASDAVYGVGEAAFSDLALALSTADNSTNDKVVVVLKNTTISGSYTVPAGVTLLVPFDAAHTLGGADPETAVLKTWKKPQAYVTLTMASGASLIVNGNLEVGASHIVCQGSTSRIYGGAVNEYYGCIATESGAEITVNAGANLYAWGYIIGDGAVTANNGGTIYEKMQVTDYRGGTNTSLLITAALLGADAFPFSQYYIQNVEVRETLNPGASLKTHASVYDAGDNLASAVVTFIGGSGAMFTTGGNTTIVKEYVPSTDRVTMSAIGDGAATSTISLGSMSLSLGNLSIDSSRFILPINSNLDIRFEGVTATTNQELLLQPGATVYVAQDAVMATNEAVYIFDIDQWDAYIFSGKTCSPIQFSPSLGGASKRTISSDAEVDINGVANVIAGVYTTTGGAQVISSEGTGRINYNAKAPSNTTINQITGGRDRVNVSVTSAILTNSNADTPTTLTAGAVSGDYFVYSNEYGMWLKNGVAPIASYTVEWIVDGTVVESDTVEEGIAPEYNGGVPTKAASAEFTYTFAGWDADGDGVVDASIGGVSGDMTITAIFAETVRTYDVIFCDADGAVLYTAEDVAYGQIPDYSGITEKNDGCYYYTISLPTIAAVDGTEATLSYTVTWIQGAPVTYTITWIVDGESTVETLPYGTMPAFAGSTDKEGDENTVYTFTGWEPAITTVTGDAAYTAVYDVHTHSYTGDVSAAAGCETTGTMTYTCSCGKSYDEEIPATGHSYSKVVTAPTCTAQGYTTYTCACGDSYTADEVDALGHSYESVTVDATCTEDGSITYTCSVCGDTYSESIPAAGHSYSKVVTAPTCTEQGYTTYTCGNCGDSYVADYVNVTDHSYKDGVCTACGAADPDYVVPSDLFDLVGANVDLGNALAMNFFIAKSDIADNSYYVEIVKENGDGTTSVTTIPAVDFQDYYGIYWQVTLEGMAAKEMADAISVTVYNGDGVQVSNPWNDSMRDYCVRQLNNPAQSKAYTLLVDMLNYGAAAQTNFGYNTDDLANSTLTAEQAAYATQNFDLGAYSNNMTVGANFIGSSLSLETNIVLSMYFNNPGAASAEGLVAKVTYTDHLGVAQIIEIAEADFLTLGGLYGVAVDTLVASDVQQLVSLEVYDGDTLVVSGADSMESYAVRQGGDINIALMIFTLSAYDYLH